MIPTALASAIARFRRNARQCRRVALTMEPSIARSAMERLAARWELMAQAELAPSPLPSPANEP